MRIIKNLGLATLQTLPFALFMFAILFKAPGYLLIATGILFFGYKIYELVKLYNEEEK